MKSAPAHKPAYYALLFLLLILAGNLPAQIITPVDSVSVPQLVVPSDADSAVVDSGSVVNDEQIEAPIKYWAEKASVSKNGNIIFLEGNAKIVYLDLTLEAAKIRIDQDSHTLFAEGISDTVDSLGNPVYEGIPVFTEKGEEPMYGLTLEYDFQTRRGKIGTGKTKMPPGYYRGTKINKIGQKTLLVEDGYFTSCEYIDNPHYYFRSDQMRVLVKDKIVARPIYFYIADVPLGILPFGVFPSKKGRQSGIVIPSYGESTFGGRFLKNMGYYWAPNDYMDATLLADFYDKLGFTYRGNLNYKVRYLLSGQISGRYFPVDPNTGKRSERWSLDFRHSQQIDPTFRISASGKFRSDKSFEQTYSSNIDRRLEQVISSNLTASKKFKGTRNSLTMNVSRTENLQSGEVDYVLPQLSFSRTQSTLWEALTGESTRGSKDWYQNIYFGYNSKLIRRGSKKLDGEDAFKTTTKQGVNHNLSMNAPQKVLKYFNITPRVSYTETWADEITTGRLDKSTNTIIKEQKKQFAVRRTFNGSMALKTTIFGMFEPNIGSLKFIRHKMDPQISYTYTPDFSSPFYGYYSSVADTAGKITKVDKFSTNPFAATPRNESQMMRISLVNLFQAKLVDGDKEKKIDLFTLSLNTSYNFSADSLPWQNLSSSLRASPWQALNMELSTTHSFYRAGPTGSGNINRSLLNEGSLPRLLNLRASMRLNITDKLFEDKNEENEESTGETDEILKPTDLDYAGGVMAEDAHLSNREMKNFKIPWRVNLNLNYSYNRSNIFNPDEKFDMGVTVNMNLTRNWRVTWTSRFDLVKHDITYQSFQIYRDLHCWEMSFNWQPQFGLYAFQINVKSSMLQDIKLTKRPSGRAYY